MNFVEPRIVAQSIEHQTDIDIFTTDNQAVGRIFERSLEQGSVIEVIPNGINTDEEFNPQKNDRQKIREELKLNDNALAVFYIGRLSEEKNPDVFVNVAKATAGQVTQPHFFMVGDGPMRKEVLEQINKNHIKSMTYLGYQSDVAKYLAAADVFVLPSAVEGFPLSILEAMAMGAAVVASDVGAVSDVIQDGVNGYIVEPGSVSAISNALRALTDSEKRTSIQKNARKDVEEKYSNKKLGANYRRLYREVTK